MVNAWTVVLVAVPVAVYKLTDLDLAQSLVASALLIIGLMFAGFLGAGFAGVPLGG